MSGSGKEATIDIPARIVAAMVVEKLLLSTRGWSNVALPAGTGHFLIEADPDFLVVGAYPPDQRDYDLCRTGADAASAARMAALWFPPTDPVAGPGGPLPEIWAEAVASR